MSALEPRTVSTPPVAASPGAARSLHAPRLYAIADGEALDLDRRGPGGVVDAVTAMADAGVRWIQLRLKRAEDLVRYEIAEACRRRLEGSAAALWIDDRADLAALVGARGVHLGQQDLSPGAARTVVGEATWIGLSCHDLAQVEAAHDDPDVDVVAVGPVFPTRSKRHPDPVIGVAGVAAARRATDKALVAIGGIDLTNAPDVLAAGADTVVMLGAFCRGDVAANSRRLVGALEEPLGARSPQAGNRSTEVAR